MDFSAHTTPYVLTAYAASIAAIAALIGWRIRDLRKALAEEKRLQDKAD